MCQPLAGAVPLLPLFSAARAAERRHRLASSPSASTAMSGMVAGQQLMIRLALASPVQVPASKQPPGHYRYELRGVVVHSGTAFAGHYYSYIKVRMGDHSPDGQQQT